MNWKETLCKLTSTPPHCVGEALSQQLAKAAEISFSPLGNVYANIQGASDYTVLLDAHVDEICFLVTSIDEKGFVHVDQYGGVDKRVLPGCEMTVWGKETLLGVFSIMPPHLKGEDSGKLPPLQTMGIDVGMNHEKATAIIRPGDTVTFRSSLSSLQSGRFAGKSLDNRAGAAILLRLLEMIEQADKPLPVSVILQFSQMEEAGTGFAGGVTGANTWLPDEAIVVDAGFADCPGCHYATPGKVGGGAMIGISPVLSRGISDKLKQTAEEHPLPYTLDVVGGRTGTNADRMITAGSGIPTGLVSYPLKNMHTPVEMIDQSDLETVATLLFSYLQKGGQHGE